MSDALPLSLYKTQPTRAHHAAATHTLHAAGPVRAFTAPSELGQASGPSALGALLHYHGIGWHHLPRRPNGEPENTPYLQQIMTWSHAPDWPTPQLDTAPQTLVSALGRAGLVAHWYQANPACQDPALYFNLLEGELTQGRPVLLLTRDISTPGKVENHALHWQVAWKLSTEQVYLVPHHVPLGSASSAWSVDRSTLAQAAYLGEHEAGFNVITVERPALPI
ncbi:hypothetical protein [Limnobacter sp.]|uniref:hypothetical protein n=1 Tax=Limnobacter sp. TaxID=2003368 RepID=UPI0035119F51